MSITKNNISNMLHKKIKIFKKDAKCLVDFFFEEISNSLKNGNNVNLYGFGKFIILKRKERIGTNPRTGKKMLIFSRRSVSFRASKNLRRCVHNFNSYMKSNNK